MNTYPMGGWGGRCDFDRAFKQAILAFALEGVDGIEYGEEGQEKDDRRSLIKKLHVSERLL